VAALLLNRIRNQTAVTNQQLLDHVRLYPTSGDNDEIPASWLACNGRLGRRPPTQTTDELAA